MKNTLVAKVLGAFGFGALVSWAITADIYENRLLREREGYDELIADKTDHIFDLIKELGNVDLDIIYPELKYVVEEEASQDKTSEETLTLDNVEVKSVVIEPGPNAFGEVIHIGENDEDTEVPEDETPEVPEDETPEVTRSNLQGLIDQYTADPDTQAEFADIAISAEEYDKTPPFVIARADYAYDEEGEHYEKITLTFYFRDRVLLDEDEDPVDVAELVGWRNLSQFGGESEDPNVVFVRNRRLMTDFEVIKEDDSELPLHVKYSMGKEEFLANKAAGLIKLRREDE